AARHGSRRDARGVRGAGPLQPAGICVARMVRARRLRAANGRCRSVAAERDGRLDLDRSSVWGHRWPHPHDAVERAGSTPGTVRSHDGVRRRRHGTRDGDRAMTSTETAPTLAMEVERDVLIVTIDRPGESVNTLTMSLAGEFEGVFLRVHEDSLIKSIVLVS